MSVTVPLVTFDPTEDKPDGIHRSKMMDEKTSIPETEVLNLASFTQVIMIGIL